MVAAIVVIVSGHLCQPFTVGIANFCGSSNRYPWRLPLLSDFLLVVQRAAALALATISKSSK